MRIRLLLVAALAAPIFACGGGGPRWFGDGGTPRTDGGADMGSAAALCAGPALGNCEELFMPNATRCTEWHSDHPPEGFCSVGGWKQLNKGCDPTRTIGGCTYVQGGVCYITY